MKQIKNFKIEKIPVWQIVIAATSEPAYEMDRVLLAENWDGDRVDYTSWTLLTGGHCSCYDFDETTWDATVCNTDELRELVSGWLEHGYGAEKIAAPLILHYIK